jgi:hypothetical protein
MAGSMHAVMTQKAAAHPGRATHCAALAMPVRARALRGGDGGQLRVVGGRK